MAKAYELPIQECIYDEASLWIARLDRELTPDEADEVNCWINASEEQKTVLFEMADLWDKMSILSQLSK